jgi:hypothetical protein
MFSFDSSMIFGVGPDRTEIVLSNNVKAFIHNQCNTFPGQTTVCYGVSGCGKTISAMYLLRGDYPYRPERAIMIAAAGSSDIATFLSNQLLSSSAHQPAAVAAAATRIHSILVAAVKMPTETTDTESSTAKNKLTDIIFKWLERLRNCWWSQPSIDIIPQIIMARPPLTSIDRYSAIDPSYRMPPLIVVDDLPRSDLNCEFVGRLYTAAYTAKVHVLILTNDRGWANTMINMNGGVKILPMEEVVTNPRKRLDVPFTEDPLWTGMYWDEDDIQALLELDQLGNIERLAKMTPLQVLQQHFARTNPGRNQQQHIV